VRVVRNSLGGVDLPEIRVLRERCVACGDCVRLCPQSGPDAQSPVLVLDDGRDVSVEDAEGCIGCFTCVEFCRAAAIVISNVGSSPAGRLSLYPTRPVSRII
jgi:ferredoxin